jgi:predicted enzyme related to lactoylglutathione lyase
MEHPARLARPEVVRRQLRSGLGRFGLGGRGLVGLEPWPLPVASVTSQAPSVLLGAAEGEAIQLTVPASLVFFANDVEATTRFYRAVGIPLDCEIHDDGPAHFAVDVGDLHVAVLPGSVKGMAPARAAGGSTFPGFWVESLEATVDRLATVAAPVLRSHEQMPWGCRVVVSDPDGRPVELNQRGHCL